MPQTGDDACRAWQLLVRFFFAQREHLPIADSELELSPTQCHVLHLLEPGPPLPMGRLAQTPGAALAGPGPAAADGPTRPDARLSCLERHRPGGSPRSERTGGATSL